jgi:hypothetical protein
MFDTETQAADVSADQELWSTSELLAGLHGANRRMGAIQREFLAYLAAVDDTKVWRDDDCRSMAHWAAVNYQISSFKAGRMIAAGHALKGLPRLSQALSEGELSLDKVVELARFATPEEEAKLISWARRVSVAAVKDKADEACRIENEKAKEDHRERELRYWDDPDGMFAMYGRLPADKGVKFKKAIEREAAKLPDTPEDDEDEEVRAAQKRADALVALASSAIAEDADADRSTVVVHVPVSTFSHGDQNGVLEGGYVIAPEVAQGLSCYSRIQFVLENETGKPVGNGRASRSLSARHSRALRRRDGFRCTFPGCGARRRLIEHHIDWWEFEGPSNLDKMLLVCPEHHDLIHVYGWNVALKDGVEPVWFRPDGTWFTPGRSPPERLRS